MKNLLIKFEIFSMYQRVSVIGVGVTTVKQACQNLSLAAPLVFFWPRAATVHNTQTSVCLTVELETIYASSVGMRIRN